MKKVITVIMTIFIVVLGLNIFAEEDYTTKDYFKKMKIEEEVNKKCTKLDKDKEEYLNSLGIMDEEISLYTSDIIKEINEADIKDIYAEISYYEIDDDTKIENNTVDINNCLIMSDEEIDRYFQRLYYPNYVKKTTLLKQVNVETKNTEKFSKTVIMIKQKSGKYSGQFLTTVTFKWLVMPKNRNIDKIYIEFDNATINIDYEPTVYRTGNIYKDKHSCKGVCTSTTKHKVTTSKQTMSKITLKRDKTTGRDLKENHYVSRDDYISIAYKLHSDSFKQADNRSPILWTKYKDEQCVATFMVYKKNKKVKKINVYPGYVHTKTGIDLSAIAADSVSATVEKSGLSTTTMMFKLATGGYKKYSTCQMGDNTEFQFKFD